MQRLDCGDVTLAYRDDGDGPGAAIVFVHGWGGDHSFLRPQHDHFAESRRVVSLDLRGHGASSAPDHGYGVSRIADDVAALCDALVLTKPVIVGHSMGGTIALDLAARYPGLPGAIVMIDTMVFPAPPMTAVLAALGDDLAGPGFDKAMATARAMLLLETDGSNVAAKVEMSLAATPRHVLVEAFREHLLAYDAGHAARLCTVPVAYIGAESPLGDTDAFQAIRPDLKIGRTLGSGHFSPLVEPDQISAMIAAFLRVSGLQTQSQSRPSGRLSPDGMSLPIEGEAH